MASLDKGILGGFSGKVGTVVGANWRGKSIIRSCPKSTKRTPTDAQLLQQMKFKMVSTFLQPLRNIQNLYFGNKTGYKSRLNMAMSYTMSNAVEVADDYPALVYQRVLITKGDLVGFLNVVVTPKSPLELKISWVDNATQSNADASDTVNMVCYCEELATFEFYEDIATREALTAEVSVASIYQGKKLNVWLYLTNTKKTSASTSSYLGDLSII